MNIMINHQKTQGVQADHIMFGTLIVVFLITLGIAAFTGTWVEAFAVGLPALLVPAALIALNPGSLSSRLAVATAFMVFSVLHIQQTHGAIEAHFIIFTLLSFLLFYRDWRPILVAAAIVAVHHVLFNFLQQAGDGFYVFANGPSLATVVIHALFVVFESAWLIYMAIQLRAEMDLFGGMPHDVARAVRQVAEGDLRDTVRVREGDTTSVIAATADMIKKLTATIGEVRRFTDSINIASNEIAQGNSDLSQRTEEQASSLEETASSMEELTSTVKQNAENAKQANELAKSAFEVAAQGGQSVNNVVATMASISDSSKKIGDIIGVIEGIAFQTNILALNAAVEAARAGEQGRGFAVVATEVRNLAQRSASAAKEIKGLIGDSVEKVILGSKQVDQAGVKMGEIVAAVERVTGLMAEIAAASKEQSSGIEEVNQAIVRMDDVTQQNAALVEEAAAAAESMKEQTELLLKVVGSFRMNDDHQKDGTLKNKGSPIPSQHRATTTSPPDRLIPVSKRPSSANPPLRINKKNNSQDLRLKHGVVDKNGDASEDEGNWKEF